MSSVESHSEYQLTRVQRLLAQLPWLALTVLLSIVLFVVLLGTLPSADLDNIARLIVPGLVTMLFLVPPTVMLMAGGSLDLSLGATMGLMGAVMVVMSEQGIPLGMSIPAAFVVGTVVGLINGTLTSLTRVHGAILTLGTGLLLRGLAFLVSSAQGFPIRDDVPLPPSSPIAILLALLGTVIIGVLMIFTPFGSRPTGDDDEPLGRRLLFGGLPFVFSGVGAALAGVVLVSFTEFVVPELSARMELNALFAALISGTALAGGTGFVLSGIFGGLIYVLLERISLAMQLTGAGRGDALVWVVMGLGILLLLPVTQMYHRLARRFFANRAAGDEEEAVDDPDDHQDG